MGLRPVLALVAAVGAAGLPACKFSGGGSVASCAINDQIDGADRQAVAANANRVIADIQAGDGAKIFAAMSRAGRSSSTPEALSRTLASARAPQRATATVTDVYLLNGAAASSSAIACLGEGGTAVVQYSGGKQAHVLATAPAGPGKEQIFEVWQTFEGGDWKVQGFWTGLSRFADRDGQAYWAKAKAERARGHDFNATMLYAAAASTFERGPYYRPPVRDAFDADRNGLKRPPLLSGDPPFRWTLDGQPFVITRVESYGTDHDLGLMLHQPDIGPLSNEQAEARNRRLIEAFRKHHPEWVDGFDFLAASTPTGPDRGFRTVFTKDKGFL